MAMTFIQLKEGLRRVVEKHMDSKQEGGTTGTLVFGNELLNKSNVQELTEYLQKQFPNFHISLRSLNVSEEKWGSVFYDWSQNKS